VEDKRKFVLTAEAWSSFYKVLSMPPLMTLKFRPTATHNVMTLPKWVFGVYASYTMNK
jgi:hypothetical protein